MLLRICSGGFDFLTSGLLSKTCLIDFTICPIRLAAWPSGKYFCLLHNNSNTKCIVHGQHINTFLMIPFVLSRTVSSVLVTDVRYKGNYAMLLAQIWEARNKAKGGKKEIEVIGSLIHCWPCLPASQKKSYKWNSSLSWTYEAVAIAACNSLRLQLNVDFSASD
jgi:hypothetical protein